MACVSRGSWQRRGGHASNRRPLPLGQVSKQGGIGSTAGLPLCCQASGHDRVGRNRRISSNCAATCAGSRRGTLVAQPESLRFGQSTP